MKKPTEQKRKKGKKQKIRSSLRRVAAPSPRATRVRVARGGRRATYRRIAILRITIISINQNSKKAHGPWPTSPQGPSAQKLTTSRRASHNPAIPPTPPPPPVLRPPLPTRRRRRCPQKPQMASSASTLEIEAREYVFTPPLLSPPLLVHS